MMRPYVDSIYSKRICFTVDTMDALERLKNIVVMAVIDGNMTESEISYLVDRCSQLGLNEDDLEKAIEFALSDRASFKIPESEDERKQLLCDLVRMMAADGKLTETEKRLFAVAAAKMDINKNQIEELIDSLLSEL